MRRWSAARPATVLLVFACFLGLNAASAHSVAADDLTWKGSVSFHWKADVIGAAGRTASADWTGTWAITGEPTAQPGGPVTTGKELTTLTLKGTSIDTEQHDCLPSDPVAKTVETRTTTAVATLTGLSMSTRVPDPNVVYLDTDQGQTMRGEFHRVVTECNGQVYTEDKNFDFRPPVLDMRFPVSAGGAAHGSATITYGQDLDNVGVLIPGDLGDAPKDVSVISWDLTQGSQHHYVIEIRSWIPQQHMVDPYFIEPVTWDVTLMPPRSLLTPNCVAVPIDRLPLVSATFRGDGHPGFDGTYRLAHRVEFDYDGQSISNLTVTPGFPHAGVTHEDKRYTYLPVGDPRPAQECTRTGTAEDHTAATASGREFQVSYRGSDPLVLGAPSVIHVIDGLFRDNGVIAIRYKLTNYPSAGIRVTRDGRQIADVITNDTSCLTDASVQGYIGAARLSYGLITTRTGTLDVDYRSPVRQTIKSTLCSGLWSP